MDLGSMLANDDIAANDFSPPNFLIPSRCPWLSRPLRDDPPLFYVPS
jgi:hypothetical protein